MHPETKIWINGRLSVRNTPGTTGAETLNQNLPEAYFETMRLEGNRIPLIHQHFSRLSRGEQVTGVPVPDDLTEHTVLNLLNFPEAKQNLTSKVSPVYRVRLTVYGPNDASLHDDERIRWSLTKTPLFNSGSPFRLCVSSIARVETSLLVLTAKTGRRNHYTEALKEALELGFDDALMLSDKGFVSETTIANLFWYSGDSFHCPEPECFPLEGIGLRAFANALSGQEIKLNTVAYTLDELLQAEAVWMINALRGPVPVASINQHRFGPASSNIPDPAAIYWDFIDKGIKH